MTRRAALALVWLAACSGARPPSVCAETYELLVATSDYSSAQVGGASFDGRTSFTGGVDLGRDPALSLSAGRAFLIARDLGTVFELDPRCGKGISKTSVLDPGRASSTNPQDVAVSPDGSLVVTRFDVPTLLLVPPSGEPARVDLSQQDGDGNPDMSGVRVARGRAYVALGRLDAKNKYRSVQASAMAIVDLATRAVVGAPQLPGRNPFGAMYETPDHALWIAAPGNFDQASEPDAGLVRFDTQTDTATLIVSEKALGGSAVEVVVDDASRCAVAIVADASAKNRTRVVVVRLATRSVSELVGWTDGFDLRSLALKDRLVLGDRRASKQGYPLHTYRVGPDCAFVPDADSSVPGPPVAVRTL